MPVLRSPLICFSYFESISFTFFDNMSHNHLLKLPANFRHSIFQFCRKCTLKLSEKMDTKCFKQCFFSYVASSYTSTQTHNFQSFFLPLLLFVTTLLVTSFQFFVMKKVWYVESFLIHLKKAGKGKKNFYIVIRHLYFSRDNVTT